MARSLERHLTRMLAVAILLAGVIAGALSFFFAYSEAEEFQDDTLRQIAALVETHRVRDTRAGARSTQAAEQSVSDPESRVIILNLPADTRPAWLPANPTSGFHTLRGPDAEFRVFVRESGRGGRIVVAQATDIRDEIAVDSALRTLVPLMLLLPLLVWLTARIVRHEMAPVRQLARTVDEQPAECPVQLPVDGIPTEIAPFLRAINRLLQRVARLMGEQRRFVADAAHELRTPLTALSLQAQNLETAPTLTAVRERVAPLKAGIERARKLAEHLLSLAKSQASPVSGAAIDVSRLARDLIADYLPLAEARNVNLGLEEVDRHVVLEADLETLRLTLKNGLDNALHYTRPGEEVTLRVRSECEEAVIEIVDGGAGVPQDERERVFQPFYRLDGDWHEGSGLGLAIAREAAARLGGVVTLHDRPDGRNGLVFRYRQRRMIG